MVVAATFGVAATDLLRMEDFTITPGETMQVSLLLENETPMTAFQADMYLPDGLTMDRQTVALTDRKATDHNIATCVQPDGSVRFMSYSMSVSPYSGNSGALVTFQLTADETLNGPVVIMMRNVLLTSTSGWETEQDETSCTVSTVNYGDANGDGEVNIIDATLLINYLLNGSAPLFNERNADMNGDGEVTITDAIVLINTLINSI